MRNVLVIDDDKKICWAFEQFLTDEGYRPIIANNAEEGLRKIRSETPEVVLLDVRLPGMSGLDALKQIKAIQPDIIVIVMTAYDSVEITIQAMQMQAFDFISKPIDLDQVKTILDRAMQMQVERSKISHSETVRGEPSSADMASPAKSQEHRLIGKSAQMQGIYKLIGVMASNTITVLIEGESGTGKELVARAIHRNSPRKANRFVPVNCGALPDELLESELFGYEAGAFTGASAKGKPGRFELADGGTLFLDEVGNMSPALQVKLQRALQEQEIERLGGTYPLKVDVRIMAATNQDLAEAVKLGRFREDLYYRFKRLSINLPPLREHTEDIPLLVDHFLQMVSVELGQNIRGVSSRCMELLRHHDWPGNVRELENSIRSAAVLSRADVILPEHLPPEILNDSTRAQSSRSRFEMALESVLKETIRIAVEQEQEALYDEVIDAVDRVLIKLLLEEVQANQTKSAKLLGISRTTLLQKIKKLGLEVNP
ncbi:MAG: sigma-54 dependent transcriptional regulator [Candidatus Poribacteria bacterium]|nr:sigma-54 dependent transcriptional regulator [Candidatus Poribacteria bacterium]